MTRDAEQGATAGGVAARDGVTTIKAVTAETAVTVGKASAGLETVIRVIVPDADRDEAEAAVVTGSGKFRRGVRRLNCGAGRRSSQTDLPNSPSDLGGAAVVKPHVIRVLHPRERAVVMAKALQAASGKVRSDDGAPTANPGSTGSTVRLIVNRKLLIDSRLNADQEFATI